MKKTILAILMALVLILVGCGKKDGGAPTLVGTWEYTDEATGIGAVYVLNEDGTGTYTMKVGEETVVYELKYETKDGHLLVTYVNNEIFTEEDVFDSEYSLRDAGTMIIKDSSGMEMTFLKK